MKAAFVIFLCGLIAVANTLPVEGPEAGNTGLSRAQVAALLKVVIPPWVTCINSNCRLGCVDQGHVAGYCAAGQCQCVPAPV
ncbi:unnamed protein product [Acanthoscelides obtectus]|uniref:Defensin n=1 Tax=Acanthoscelides obtectus TaxID=200917 RepID=A0A9P0KUC7_ACAOB|nr:unnamed protein product [Acanthoscelides obtectus]CAK1674643.1 hypothetical protein AOBTE_LOCUS29690 [Acanthoscelides obtectus]